LRRPLYCVLLSVVVLPCALLVLVDLSVGDYELFRFLNQELINPALDVACMYVSPGLFFLFYGFVLAIILVSRKRASMATGMISVATGPLSYGVGSLIKLLVKRPRPFDVLSGVRVLGFWDTSSYSFPSTTTMLAFGLSLPMLILLEKRRYGATLSALSYFIGFSVIYAGFHFPADVVAGIIFSLGIASMTSMMKDPLARFLERFRAHTSLS